jgi:low affinity Fe/Cu permease
MTTEMALITGISVLATCVIPVLWNVASKDRRRMYSKLDECERDRNELWMARDRDKHELIVPLIKLMEKLGTNEKEVVENIPIRNVSSGSGSIGNV